MGVEYSIISVNAKLEWCIQKKKEQICCQYRRKRKHLYSLILTVCLCLIYAAFFIINKKMRTKLLLYYFWFVLLMGGGGIFLYFYVCYIYKTKWACESVCISLKYVSESALVWFWFGCCWFCLFVGDMVLVLVFEFNLLPKSGMASLVFVMTLRINKDNTVWDTNIVTPAK